MSDSREQHAKIKGDNNSVTNVEQSISEKQVVLPKEIYKESLENAVRVKELELQVAHNDEKMQLYKQIDGLQNKLANLPESLKKAQETNAELVARLEQMGSKAVEKKFQKAINAFKENNFTKADKILTEIEDNEKISKKEFGVIAYARGTVAEQEVRWKDAAEHYTRAAQLDPCFETLLKVQKLTYNIEDYDSALSFGLDLQKAAIKEHGEDTEEYATSLNNLGATYNILKEYKLAEPLHTEALKIRQNILGNKHPEVGVSLNNLGGMYQEKEQHRKAINFFKRALNIHKKSLRLKHPITASTLYNLGCSYKILGEIKKAKPILKQALKIRREILGDNHPDTANSFSSLSGLYFRQGQYKKAEQFALQAVEIFEANFGHDHPSTKTARHNYEALKQSSPNPQNQTPIKWHNQT